MFHLKRFSYSRWLKNKLDTFVNFPIHNLDLSKYVKSKDASEGPHVYELYAISNHYGGLGGGHYSAYCKVMFCAAFSFSTAWFYINVLPFLVTENFACVIAFIRCNDFFLP